MTHRKDESIARKLEREIYAYSFEARLAVERALACVGMLTREAGTKDAWQAQERLTTAASVLGNMMVAFDDNTVVELRAEVARLEEALAAQRLDNDGNRTLSGAPSTDVTTASGAMVEVERDEDVFVLTIASPEGDRQSIDLSGIEAEDIAMALAPIAYYDKPGPEEAH